MRVSEIMSKCVTVCTEDTGLEEVYELIQKCAHKLVVVVDSNAHRVPIGIASEHTICEQVIARGRNPRTLSAGSVMDARVKKISQDQFLESIDAKELDDLTAIVVVNADRQIIGLISKEVIERSAPVAVPERTLNVTITAAPATQRRVSEIPAFGWIQ